MAYKPRNWTDNEAIPAAGLNRLEGGVSDAAQVADLAASQAAAATAIGEANGKDIAEILDQLDELRESLGKQ